MKKSCLIALFVMCGMFAMTAYSQTVVPNTFLANTPAKAEEVNANFSKIATDLNTLRSAAASNVTRMVEIEDLTGIGAASCASDEILVGGGCICSGDWQKYTNAGVLIGCYPAGHGYVGGCISSVLLQWNPSYGTSPVRVKVICMKAIPESQGVSAVVIQKSLLALSDPAEEIEKLRSLIREQQKLQPGR